MCELVRVRLFKILATAFRLELVFCRSYVVAPRYWNREAFFMERNQKRLSDDVRVSRGITAARRSTKDSLRSTVSFCSMRNHTHLHLLRKSHLLLGYAARLCSPFLGAEGRVQHPSYTETLVWVRGWPASSAPVTRERTNWSWEINRLCEMKVFPL